MNIRTTLFLFLITFSLNSQGSMDKFNELKSIVDNLEADFSKFYEKDNQAAGTRIRKGMQELKFIQSSLLEDINLQIAKYERSRTTLMNRVKKEDLKLKTLAIEIRKEVQDKKNSKSSDESIKLELFLGEISLVKKELQVILMRLRKRPDILAQEWDQLIDETLSSLEENPLYNSSTIVDNPIFQDSGISGDNPLYE